MKLGLMLGDLWRSLVRRPATERYPFQRRAAPSRLRGPVQFDRTLCTGCRVCVMDCPANALTLVTLDKASKRFAMEYHVDRWPARRRRPCCATTGSQRNVQRVLAERSASGAPLRPAG
jgi:Fe-S-cluster-containing dehydrogenase component